MLKSIEYSVTFATTGRTLSERITFQTGFGTITGPNEAGKSFVIEMIRWALFGSSALRGKASEMKKASVELVFETKGETYKIKRTPTNAKMFRGDVEVAVGTTPVNEKVVGVLGFGLAVLDFANIANQGEIEKLVTMKPAERKRLVDSVIGLGVIDDMAKLAATEALAVKRQASDLADSVQDPVAPSKPDGYRDLASVDADLAALSAANDELQQLRGWLTREPEEPKAPVDPMLPDAEFLSRMAAAQEELQQQLRRNQLELNTLPAPSPYTEDLLDIFQLDWADYRASIAHDKLVAENPKPLYTLRDLERMEQDIANNDLAVRAEQLRAEIAKAEGKGVHTCPACSHEWSIEHDHIASLKAKLAQTGEPVRVDVPLTPAQIKTTRAQIEAYEIAQQQLANFPSFVKTEKPELSEAEIEQHRARLGYDEQRSKLTADVAMLEAALADQPDYAAQLKQRRTYDEAQAKFLSAAMDWETWRAEAAQKRARATLLEVEVQQTPALNQLRTEVVVYDTLMARYAVDVEKYTTVMASVQELQTEAEDWEKAKTALGSLRGLVKQHLMPSLNKVASYYLVEMTGGQRQTIYADEEFNIMVDGQELNTLSGSGKAVACLALRLGLGQVLTNNVLSLFIGDEIDASMDKDRAENTAATLQTLKKRLSQILLVTHKSPAADYYISVGSKHEQFHEAA